MLTGRLEDAVELIGRWLMNLYALELDFRPERFLLSEEAASALMPHGGPRTGVLVAEQEGVLEVGLVVDDRDVADLAILVEETSHLVCLAWHASRDLRVSQLGLEIQGEIDRFLFRRLASAAAHIPDPFGAFGWADWLDATARRRYWAAHHAAARYCGRLGRRYPGRHHTPALLEELRIYYRASPEAKHHRRVH